MWNLTGAPEAISSLSARGHQEAFAHLLACKGARQTPPCEFGCKMFHIPGRSLLAFGKDGDLTKAVLETHDQESFLVVPCSKGDCFCMRSDCFTQLAGTALRQ